MKSLKLHITNWDFLDEQIKQEINKLINLRTGEVYSYNLLKKSVEILKQNLKNHSVDFIAAPYFNGGEFCISFFLKRNIKNKNKNSFKGKLLTCAKKYYEAVLDIRKKMEQKVIPFRYSIRKGYYDYQNEEIKSFHTFFSKLTSSEYDYLNQVALKDSSVLKQLYAMNALQHQEDKNKVLSVLSEALEDSNPWTANNAAYFLIPLSKKIDIPSNTISSLLNYPHMGVITKALHFLEINRKKENIKKLLLEETNLKKLQEFSQWKGLAIAKSAKIILKEINI